jgi:hypothetical protein
MQWTDPVGHLNLNAAFTCRLFKLELIGLIVTLSFLKVSDNSAPQEKLWPSSNVLQGLQQHGRCKKPNISDIIIMHSNLISIEWRDHKIYNLNVWLASSRVGLTITARKPSFLGPARWWMTGIRKAAVLPEPVGAHAKTWRPYRTQNTLHTNTATVISVQHWQSKCNKGNHDYRAPTLRNEVNLFQIPIFRKHASLLLWPHLSPFNFFPVHWPLYHLIVCH